MEVGYNKSYDQPEEADNTSFSSVVTNSLSLGISVNPIPGGASIGVSTGFSSTSKTRKILLWD